MVLDKNIKYVQSPDCIFKEVDADLAFVLKVDDSDFYFELTNIVRELWLYLETPKSLQQLQDFSAKLFVGKRSISDESTREIIASFLEHDLITSNDV